MGFKIPRTPEFLESLRDNHTFWDDFDWFISPHWWTKNVGDVAGGVGITPSDAANGILVISPEDATDNDEAYLESTQETWLLAADKSLNFEARVSFTEANTDDANIIVGMMNAVGADTLLDNGGGPAASYSGFVFFKVDGGTVWQVENSIAGTQQTTQLTAANSLTGAAITAGGAYQRLRCEWRPKTATVGDFTFFVDGVAVAKHSDQVFTSATEMQIVLGCKNGSTSPETLLADYVFAEQLR